MSTKEFPIMLYRFGCGDRGIKATAWQKYNAANAKDSFLKIALNPVNRGDHTPQ